MNSLNKWVFSICFSVVVILAQVIVAQHITISGLQSQLEYAKSACRLSGDQISDMMYQLSQLQDERNFERTQNYIAGVVDTIDRRDEFSAIWHDGYSRGTAIQQYAAELDAKKVSAYTDEKKN
jgi:hypothetical protein